MRWLMLVLFCVGEQALGGEFRAGAAKVDITPPDGTPMAGFYVMRPSAGVIDPIFARAIVVEQDGAKAALVGLDICYTTRSLVIAARKLIEKKTGIAPQRVMICATHSHSGPALPRDGKIDDITGAKSPATLAYLEKLVGAIAQAVVEADGKLAPAKSATAIGREETVSFNRRYVMKDGSIGWNPGKGNTNIVRPAGPIDPDVGVWYLSKVDKNVPLATFVNFAMHATVINGTKISPDFPGYLSKRLAEYHGPEMLTFFANGCCGNINQINPHWSVPQTGVREGERVGTVLAAAVYRAWPELAPQKTWAPRVAREVVTLERRQFTADEIEEAKKLVGLIPNPKLGTPAMAKAVCIVDTAAKADVPLEAEVQAIALGEEMAVVALPGEIFVELGLTIKKQSPFKYTFIAELANGSIGYVPNASAYAEGQYEVLSARAVEGSGEKLVEVAVKLLKEVSRK